MRTIKSVLVLLAVLVAFSACKKEQTPEVVAETFMNHMLAGEYQQAMLLGTESTQQMLKMFETLESLGGESMKNEDAIKVSNMECVVDGDKAICSFMQEGEASEVNLVKLDGKWLVDMKKENPFGDMEFDMEEGEEWEEDTLEVEETEQN